MNIILNRLRGTWPWFSIINALLWGCLVCWVTDNPEISIWVAIGYFAGEAPGWGEWIGGLIRQDDYLNEDRRQGEKYGIMQVALLFADRGSNLYDIIALTLRGLLWWVPTFIPFLWLLDAGTVVLAALLLAVCFPLSVLVGRECTFTLPLVNEPWSRAEVLYGGAQDVVLAVLLLSVAI